MTNAHQLPACQKLPAKPVEEVVVKAFLEALTPAQLDLYNQAIEQQKQHHQQIQKAQQQQLQRLRYEADLAKRRYQQVDPDNRLVAGELERLWEVALQELQQHEWKYQQAQQSSGDEKVSNELRASFEALCDSLPSLFASESLDNSQRKALLRTLLDKVVLGREKENVNVRIVWQGGAYSEFQVPIHVGFIDELSRGQELRARVAQLEQQNLSEREMASLLTEEGFRSPHDTSKVLLSTVTTIRRDMRTEGKDSKRKSRWVEGFWTVSELAERLNVTKGWLYHKINQRRIEIQKDPQKGCYLFPDSPETIEQFQQFLNGTRKSLRF